MDRTKPPHPIDVRVGNRIRERRILLGLSQTAVASRIGISFQAVQKYETGHIRASASRLAALAKVLDVPVGYFFDGIDQPEDDCGQSNRLMLEFARVAGALPDDLKQAFLTCMRSFVKSPGRDQNE